MKKVYACIDLKSFYASCECVMRSLDPLTTNLVVADKERTEKTICLAVSPSLKEYGLSGRARLYEVISKINEVNAKRKRNNKRDFIGKSYNANKIKLNPLIEVDYIVAKPRMRSYMKYSSLIYQIYLSFLAKEDIYVYSIDEIFCDLTNYLKYYKMNAKELVSKIIKTIYQKTGITATAGIGENLYLAKEAMDILAKHQKPDAFGVRLFELDIPTYQRMLWNHRPLTDFWRVGMGYAKKLEINRMYTMGDICKMSIQDENKLFKLFGVNAEILIDHAWGYEPCTIKDIKEYKPEVNSISSGQVLPSPYSKSMARVIVLEMVDNLSLQLVSKNCACNQVFLTIGYDVENLNNNYSGLVKKDYYGRNIPASSHGSVKLDHFTSSTKLLSEKTKLLYDTITNSELSIRRIYLGFNNVVSTFSLKNNSVQLDLFSNNNINLDLENEENKVQKAILDIKSKYGKNAILRGIDYTKDATMRKRNEEVGGHHE